MAEWDGAPAALVAALARHAREALPRRCGDVEPLQHRDLNGLAGFAREHDTAWLAARPFFGGSADPPDRKLGLAADLRVLRADERWREAVVDLFAAVALAAGATRGEAYAERNWNVSANNRLSIDANWIGRDHRGPPWLEWDGALIRHGELPRERRGLFR